MKINVAGGKYRELKKVTLTANVESTQTFSRTMERVLVKNLGTGSCFIEFDATASAASFELQDGDAYEFIMDCNSIHLFSTATPKVQLLGFRG